MFDTDYAVTDDAVNDTYTHSLRECAAATPEAVKILKQLMKDTRCKPIDRIKAAATIIEQGDRWQNFRLEERIADLERRIKLRAGDVLPEDADERVPLTR
jgi:hypothetical protein